ncbi:hypothetical protein AVEN_269211-1 [Araneus ventricosus]|uniref:Uncharacterized protein n=1 Tax=Araneus ventricosus TaxID=182803 RepID=A0A4Y2I2I5_ARAVE|nr:hypothetical protein AVEN_269211-1 [Araneus ventricosus]
MNDRQHVSNRKLRVELIAITGHGPTPPAEEPCPVGRVEDTPSLVCRQGNQKSAPRQLLFFALEVIYRWNVLSINTQQCYTHLGSENPHDGREASHPRTRIDLCGAYKEPCPVGRVGDTTLLVCRQGNQKPAPQQLLFFALEVIYWWNELSIRKK